MSDTVKELVDEFNDGYWDDISGYFNDDISLFFDFVDKSKMINEIDYFECDDKFKNYLLLYKLNNDEISTLNFIVSHILTDVDIEKDGYYLSLNYSEDLSPFFEGYSRDASPRDLAKVVLAEDDFYDRWWDTTDDVYSDVIDVLDSTNEARLAKYIFNKIGNQDLNIEDYSSDFFHDLMSEQGREDFFQITDNVIYDLIHDEEAMKELLNGDLDDLKHELYSIHNSAYNNAYESECYNLVMDGLQEYFVGKLDFVEVKQTSGKVRYYPKIKIRDFYSNVMTFLNEYKGYSDTLDYKGSYREMMYDLFYTGALDEISFRIPDYPDYQLVDKYINEYFSDYI